jgi:hypothetical protein
MLRDGPALPDYRVRSNYWLGGNLRGAPEELIDRQRLEQALANRSFPFCGVR